MISFAYVNGNPFTTNEKIFSTSLPFYFFTTGENSVVPNYAVWLNLTTENTVGSTYIAGDEINVSGIIVIGNITDALQVLINNGSFVLGFQNALAWNNRITFQTPKGNFSESRPADIGFSINTDSNIYETPCCYNIYFPFAGSFAPILYVYNGTNPVPYQILNENSSYIAVESPSAATNQSYGQVNEALTFALVFFGLVELGLFASGQLNKAFVYAKNEPDQSTKQTNETAYNEDPKLKEVSVNKELGKDGDNATVQSEKEEPSKDNAETNQNS